MDGTSAKAKGARHSDTHLDMVFSEATGHDGTSPFCVRLHTTSDSHSGNWIWLLPCSVGTPTRMPLSVMSLRLRCWNKWRITLSVRHTLSVNRFIRKLALKMAHSSKLNIIHFKARYATFFFKIRYTHRVWKLNCSKTDQTFAREQLSAAPCTISLRGALSMAPHRWCVCAYEPTAHTKVVFRS